MQFPFNEVFADTLALAFLCSLNGSAVLYGLYHSFQSITLICTVVHYVGQAESS